MEIVKIGNGTEREGLGNGNGNEVGMRTGTVGERHGNERITVEIFGFIQFFYFLE